MAAPTKQSAMLYAHPDGHTIEHFDDSLTVCSSDGIAISLPIGPLGLADLGRAMQALAGDADDSESRGNELADKLLNKLLKVNGDSAKSFKAVEQALNKLAKLPNQKDAIAGFSAAIYPVICIGVANIPKQTGSAN
jgi:hypothetical protein